MLCIAIEHSYAPRLNNLEMHVAESDTNVEYYKGKSYLGSYKKLDNMYDVSSLGKEGKKVIRVYFLN